ncbi:hypothetical protein BDZ85DRAFT_293321 [Elsinoe ampelina]|uniref:Uncharacterized protein n=1 Tax=Elsinoe ampelina TaxID=302913 RepID=A0A6A6GL02_9PEZI|nr:hypothetical protein BDZ85DRAFT_293321 [Elsinoe ampelina]
MYETTYMPERLMIRDLSIRMAPIQTSHQSLAEWYWITNWTVYPLGIGARARWTASRRTLAIDQAQCCVSPPAFIHEDFRQKDTKQNCHLRLWADGRLAIALYGDNEDGTRVLYVGIARIRMTGTQHDLMCNALCVFHVPELFFESWYETTSAGRDEASFATRALEEVGHDAWKFNGLLFWDMVVETRNLLGWGAQEEEDNSSLDTEADNLDAEVAYEEWLNEFASA